MSDFEKAMNTILDIEGRFSNDPDDPGGPTNFGLSMRFLKSIGDADGDGYLDGDFDHDGDIDIEDIRNMKRDDSLPVYSRQWWYRYHYNNIRAQGVATRVMSFSINMGARQSHKILQRACRATGEHLVDDGIIGPKTLEAVNISVPGPLIAALRSEAAGVYRQIVIAHPSSKKFLKGWLNRAYS